MKNKNINKKITAFYMFVLDERVSASGPICGGVGSIKTFIRKGNISYHRTYWWIPNILGKGDQAEFAAACAPKPLMLWAPKEDIGMPKEGVDQFISTVKPAYECAGKPSNFVIHQPPGGHSFTIEAFETMNKFFDTQFSIND